MRGNPDTEDGDVDGGDENNGAPFDVPHRAAMFGNERNSIDDDLHEQLDLENPEEQDEKQHRDAISSLASVSASGDDAGFLSRRTQCACQEEPANNSNAYVDQNLTPQHVDVDGPQRVTVPPCLQDRLPYGEKAKPNREACCHASKLEVVDGCRHDELSPLLNQRASM